MSDDHKGYNAIRQSVALGSDLDMFCIHLAGKASQKILEDICPCEVFLQDGQMKHTLLLNEQAIPIADVYICREGSNAYLLGYSEQSADDLISWIQNHRRDDSECQIQNIMTQYVALSIDGPYAWELASSAMGPMILGIPYLGLLRMEDRLAFRAGETGEYGYCFLVPEEEKLAIENEILTKGEDFGLEKSTVEDRSQCSMENFFFDIKREGRYGLNPFELQLQWRISHKETAFPGSDEIKSIREKGWSRRLTSFVSNEPVHPDQDITMAGSSVGKVLSSGYSPAKEVCIGKALLDKPFWHAGLDGFMVGSTSLTTVSAPVIRNISVRINPHLHSYHSRKGASPS